MSTQNNRLALGRRLERRPGDSLSLREPTLDDITRKAIMNDIKRSNIPTEALQQQQDSNVDPQPSIAGNDMNLVTSLLKRINNLEIHIRKQKTELLEKESTIQVLTENANAVSHTTQQVLALEAKVQALTKENERLQRQISEMDSFLQDYGLQWVGNNDSNSNNNGEESAVKHDTGTSTTEQLPARSNTASVSLLMGSNNDAWNWKQSHVTKAESNDTMKPDLKTLQLRVSELNNVAAESEIGSVTGKDNMREIKAMKTIPIVLYSNGLTIGFDSPLRPYDWPLTQAFLKDLYEGYFPYEFKHRFPEGVPLEIVDRLSVVFDKAAFFEMQQKSGSKPHSITDSEANRQFPHIMTKEELLERLPKNVIKNGRIVNVRNDFSTFLTNDSNSNNNSNSSNNSSNSSNSNNSSQTTASAKYSGYKETQSGDVITLFTEAHLLKQSCEDCSDRPITVLRVRYASKSGGKTLILSMFYNQTIKDLRAYIDEHRRVHSMSGEYTLRTAFPNREYNDDSELLETAGLVPNATLFI